MHDLVSDIIAYENGEMSQEEMIPFFQHLKDSGTIQHLQGSYQRTMQALVEGGLVI